MFEETKEEKKRERKKWFQSLSLLSSEEESDYSTSDSSLLTEVQNANLRFPYPIFSDESDEELLASNNKNNYESQSNQLLKQTKSSCRTVKDNVGSLRTRKSNKSLLKNKTSGSTSSKYKFVRDGVKKVWNYTNKRKKRHVYHRPSVVFSTSEDDSGPEKKKKKISHGRKPPQLKPALSEENLNESTALPKSEFNDCYHVSRPFSSFLDSSSNNENSDCKESNSTRHNKKSLSYSFHDLSSSDNSTDTEHCRHPTLSNIMDSECIRNSEKRRMIHCISSSEEENKDVFANKCKTKIKKHSLPQRNILPSKHPFKNLIASQQLKEDNVNMKRGLKPTSQRIENIDTSRPIEAQNKSSKKCDYPQRKIKANPPSRNVGSSPKVFITSKLKKLKKHFISSNQQSVELCKRIRSNMNMNKKDKTIGKHTLKHKVKKMRTPHEDKNEEGRYNSISKETAREELKKKEAKYTVNVNVYCNSNKSDPSRSIPSTPEECHSKHTTGQALSQNLDINLSVVQEEKYTKLTSKKVRISHINQSKSKLECKTNSCELNTEGKVKKDSAMKRGNNHTTEPSCVNKPGQFDLVGNILSQMQDNPFTYQKGTKKSSDQCPDQLSWFSSVNPAVSNIHSSSIISNNSYGFNKEPAQYASTSVFKAPILQTAQLTASNQSLSVSDPTFHPLYNTPCISVDHQENTIAIEPHNTSCDSNQNNSLVPTETRTVSTASLVHKHSAKEVIIPFYLANHDEYEERLENPQNNKSKDESGLNRENVKPGIGEGSNLCYLQANSSKSNTIRPNSERSDEESKIFKENISKKSYRALPTAIPNDTKNVLKGYSAVTCQRALGMPVSKNEHNKNTGKNIVQKNIENVNVSSRNTDSKMANASKDESIRGVITSENPSLQNLSNELNCKHGNIKKGVKIRLQGNEYVWYQTSNSKKGAEDPSLNLLDNSLTTVKLASFFNTMGNNYSEEKKEAKNKNVTSENLGERKNVASPNGTNVGNKEIEDLSSNIENTQHSSSSDSDENSSSSDDSSSSSASSHKSGESNSSGSSTSENTIIKQDIQKEKKELPMKASTFISDTDLEVITLDSSSDDEPHTSESAPVIGFEPLTHKKKVDNVELMIEKLKPQTCGLLIAEHIKAGPEKSIFDPNENNGECETSNVSISSVDPIYSDSTTNNNGESGRKTSLIGKIRIKTAEELNSGILQTENDLKNCSKQTEADFLRPNSSSQTIHRNVEEARVTEMAVDLLAPLKLQLSKVLSENKSLYKVQSTIPITKEACKSPTQTVPNKDKYNHTNTLFVVKTGEKNYKILQHEKNLSNAEKPITNGITKPSNSTYLPISNLPKNSQSKKPVPKLVTIASKPSVLLIPAPSISQAQNHTQLTTILHVHSATCRNSDSNLSSIPPDSQHLTDIPVVTVIRRTPEKSYKSQSFIQTPSNHQSKQPRTHLIKSQESRSQETLEATFIKLCDELFTEVVCLKIPKMVDDLHLTIVYDGFKEERLKRTEQLLSVETIVSEKSRAEKDFNDQIRIRAHSFVPLFTTVINKINKSNLKTLVIALYIRFINQLQRIDPKYINYRLSLRHIIKSMLQKSGSTYTDVCQILSDNDSGFEQNYLFIENLIRKYDLYVEQRRQKQINNELGSSETETNKERQKQQSKEINSHLREISTPDNCSTSKTSNQKPQETGLLLQKNVTGHSNSAQMEPDISKNSEPTKHISVTNLDSHLREISTPDNCSTSKTSNQKPQETGLLLQKNVTGHSNLAQIEPDISKNSEPTKHISVTNLDDLMFNSLFKQS